jgi:glycosyltransferase involved in cell wall biosynthesis
MRRLLLVSHRSPDQTGGPTARWRAFRRHLPNHGWEVDVLSAPERPSASEFASNVRGRRRVIARARVMAAAGGAADPLFAAMGLRPEALPLSMTWVPRGAQELRRRLRGGDYTAVLATGPPMVALLAARLVRLMQGPPLIVELRDLWAANPAFDRGGPILPGLERWVFGAAEVIVTCTPEATRDMESRHPRMRGRVFDIANGFDSELLSLRRPAGSPFRRPLTLLHSGTLTADRPLGPLIDVLAQEHFRAHIHLVLHGYLSPSTAAQVAAARRCVSIEVLPPSGWCEAVQRIAAADVTLITQAHSAGDATAVASKVYEYLAAGRPVLCLSDGGATEALLHRLGAGAYVASLRDPASIASALDRLLVGPAPEPLPPERLRPYDRGTLAARMADLLDRVSGS